MFPALLSNSVNELCPLQQKQKLGEQPTDLKAKFRTPSTSRTHTADPTQAHRWQAEDQHARPRLFLAPLPWTMWGSHEGIQQENNTPGSTPGCKFRGTLQATEGNSCDFVSHKRLQGKSGSVVRPGRIFLHGRRTVAMKRSVFLPRLPRGKSPAPRRLCFPHLWFYGQAKSTN